MPIIRRSSSRHARLAFLAVLALSAGVFAAGCASRKSAEPAIPAPAGTRENGALVLASADNNRTAELRVGERFRVSLPENPGTGYTWAIDETDRRLLVLDDTEYAEPTESSIGARGRRIFAFTARQPGEVALKLKYWRFWDGDGSIAERYGVTLKIAPQ